MGSSATAALHDLEQGRAAYAEHRWALAFKALSRADEASPLAALDLSRAGVVGTARRPVRRDPFEHGLLLLMDGAFAAARMYGRASPAALVATACARPG